MESDHEKLMRRNRELSILNTVAAALNRQIDLNAAVQEVLAQVAALLGLHTGWVWLINEDTGEEYLAAAQNLPPVLAKDPTWSLGVCHCLESYHEGDMAGAANINVVTCSRLKNLHGGTDGLRYHASVPLYARDQRKLGMLNVASKGWQQLSPDDLSLLYTIGDLLGMAIERAHLFERSTQLGALEERNRLAREIHDTLAQGLAGIALQLETLDALLDAEAPHAKLQAIVQKTLTLTRSHLEEARRSVLDLRAAPLEGRSLPEALAALAAGITALPVRFVQEGESRPLTPRLEAGLYRIAQEALSNIIEHAQAQQALLTLSLQPDAICLRVEDDGIGFDPLQVAADSFGLIGLRERAHLLGGALHVESAPEGSLIIARIPL